VSAKKFRQRGWVVGNKVGDDLCNICVASNKIARKVPDNKTGAPITLKLKDLSKLQELQGLAGGSPPALALAAGTPPILALEPPTAQETPVDKLLTVKEAVEAKWATMDRMYDYIRRGKLKCIKNERGAFVVAESELKRFFSKKNPPPAPMLNEPAPVVVEAAPQLNEGEPPMAMITVAAMTKEDRRIIFSEIDSHYLDEMRGYAKDWDDMKVAMGLKVPVEWVRTIREDNFGAEKGDQIGIEIEKLKAASVEAQNLIDTMRTLWAEMDKMLEAFETKQAALSTEANKVHSALVEAKAKIDAYTANK
jgi:hypothetical protein